MLDQWKFKLFKQESYHQQFIQLASHLMPSKWRIYFLTLFSYAITHAVRTMWSAIKNDLTKPPFNYQTQFLGLIDMVFLFTIAIFINLVGLKVEAYGAKKCLLFGMSGLLVINTVVGVFLNLNLTDKWLYIVVFGLGVGIFGGFAWPSCLYMLSFYFNKKNGLPLTAWNGTSQLGDFISLITYFVIVNTADFPEISFFYISGYIFLLIIVDLFLLPKTLPSKHEHTKQQIQNNDIHLNEENAVQKASVELEIKAQQKMLSTKTETGQANTQKQPQKQIDSESDTVSKPDSASALGGANVFEEQKKVTLLTVWLLPGVALNVLSYGLIKSVNAFVVSWMVYYLLAIDLGNQAILITILWSVSVFIGGILCAIVNKRLTNLFFIFQLFMAALAFIFIESFHLKIYEIQIIIGVIVCALCYGGPYNVISTAIPIKLGSQASVTKFTNGKAAIISLMEGFGQFACGVSIIIVPSFGVQNIHIAGCVYCCLAAMILIGESYRLSRVKKTQKQRQLDKIVVNFAK